MDEKDMRMVLVAFEDAATWCEGLADLTDEWIAAARAGKRIPAAALQRAVDELTETRRFLASHRVAVGRIKERTGLP